MRPDEPLLPFPQIILLQQKYTHHALDVHDEKTLQQFLQDPDSPHGLGMTS